MLKRLRVAYTRFAVVSLNTLVLFVALNVGIYLVYRWMPPERPFLPVFDTYGYERLQAVYPGWSRQAVEALLAETWTRPYQYAPFVQFKERRFSGAYVNISPYGYRLTPERQPWPPADSAYNVFLFGGSTTFGYGVADSQAVGYYLQRRLRDVLGPAVQVYNFGTSFYFSTQERILFETLLLGGHVPDLAVFVDGLNDFYHFDGQPEFTGVLSRLFDEPGRDAVRRQRLALLRRIPIVRAARSLAQRLGLSPRRDDPGTAQEQPDYRDPQILLPVLDRYLANKAMIEAVGAQYGVQTAFVWQPVPTYRYDDTYHLFLDGGHGRNTYSRRGYAYMAGYAQRGGAGANFIWCADIQQGLPEALYVDKVHYTPKLAGMLAACIAQHLKGRGIGRMPFKIPNMTDSLGPEPTG